MHSPTSATHGSPTSDPRGLALRLRRIVLEGNIAVGKSTCVEMIAEQLKKRTNGVVDAVVQPERVPTALRVAIYNPDATPEERSLAICCLQWYMQPSRSLDMRKMQVMYDAFDTALGTRVQPPLCQPVITDRGAGGGLTFALSAIKCGTMPLFMGEAYIDTVIANAEACADPTFDGPPLLYPYADCVVAIHTQPEISHARMLHRGETAEKTVAVDFLRQMSDAHACYIFAVMVYTNVSVVVVAHEACNPNAPHPLEWYCTAPTPNNCGTKPSLEELGHMVMEGNDSMTGRIRFVTAEDTHVDPERMHVWPDGFPTPDINMIKRVPTTVGLMFWQLANGEDVFCAAPDTQ